jgi:hypothetical protein
MLEPWGSVWARAKAKGKEEKKKTHLSHRRNQSLRPEKEGSKKTKILVSRYLYLSCH